MAIQYLDTYERMLYQTLVGVQIYDNSNVLKTISDINFTSSINKVVFKFTDGSAMGANLNDKLKWEMNSTRAPIQPNGKLKKRDIE